jgi:hypothetical protein
MGWPSMRVKIGDGSDGVVHTFCQDPVQLLFRSCCLRGCLERDDGDAR